MAAKEITPPTDSAWLWLGIFLAGAIMALVLVGPKYERRQPQLERQYLARQMGGQAVADGLQPGDDLADQPPRLSLRPLAILLAALLMGASAIFWVRRWRLRRLPASGAPEAP